MAAMKLKKRGEVLVVLVSKADLHECSSGSLTSTAH